MSVTTMLPSFVRSALTLAPASLALALAACTPSAGQGREEEADAGGVSARAPNEGSMAPAYAGPNVDVIAGLPWPEAPVASDQTQRKAPFSLTASDGAGLRLVALTARGVVEGPLAFTELRLVFDNPEDRTIEGRFEIEMPPGAAISRFAMKVDERWQEGEVVERQAARAVYEDFLHRREDPALLEKSAGNSFSARVFPIPARGRKELIVAYSQGLADPREPYRVMLRGLPEIELLDASVVVREPNAGDGPGSSLGGASVRARVLEVRKERFTPDRDLEVPALGGADGLRHGRLALARVTPAGAMPSAPVGSLCVLFDTSGSRALGFEGAIGRLRDVLEDLRRESGEDFALRIVAFDQEIAEIYSGPASRLDAAALDRLRARRAMGASDLGGALRAVAARPGGARRVLVISDGIATAHEDEIHGVSVAARGLAEVGIVRADAIVDGGIQDTAILKAITTGALPKSGVVIDGRMAAGVVAHKLASATLPALDVEVPGASWVWPATIEGVQPGDAALVFADLPEEVAMTVALTGEARIEVPVATMPAERPLLERAWVGAQIARLEAECSALPVEDAIGRATLKQTIVDLSTRFRVLSEFTALLVLETEDDYARFKIDRAALADVLSVGPAGMTVLARSAASPPPVAKVPEDPGVIESRTNKSSFMVRPAEEEASVDAPGAAEEAVKGGAFAAGSDDGEVWGGLQGAEIGESFGVGGLGLVGTGRGGGGASEATGTGAGYGRGAGAGFGGRGARVPEVRIGRAGVAGALDRSIIRRIVRAHINEVRLCYRGGLERDPNLGGWLVVQFRIEGDGRVSAAVLAETSLPDRRVSSCVVEAIKGWRFPRPQDGATVVVDFPRGLGGGARDMPARGPAYGAEDEAEDAADAAAADDADDEEEEEDEARRPRVEPYAGTFLEVHRFLRRGDRKAGLARALAWHDESPGDVLALVAVGDAAEASGDRALAARAFGSIIDLFPARADLRRFAGARLEALGGSTLALALDTYSKAAESRPDHPSSHRLLAFAQVKAGDYASAFATLELALDRSYPAGRFAGYDRILRADLEIVGAAWVAASPEYAKSVDEALQRRGLARASAPSTRFVLNWETDANDVDFHVRDGRGGHAYYSSRALASGGELFDDVTTGYGPECFAIPGKATAYPYTLEAHYYSRGPMGYGMGKLEIVQHDGAGRLKFDERPFVIMQDDAFVDLGKLRGPL